MVDGVELSARYESPAEGRAGDCLMVPEEVAEFLRVPESTVVSWRRHYYGGGPRWVKVGSRVRYWRSDVLAWLADHEWDANRRLASWRDE